MCRAQCVIIDVVVAVGSESGLVKLAAWSRAVDKLLANYFAQHLIILVIMMGHEDAVGGIGKILRRHPLSLPPTTTSHHLFLFFAFCLLPTLVGRMPSSVRLLQLYRHQQQLGWRIASRRIRFKCT